MPNSASRSESSLRTVEEENRQFASRYLEVEEENNNLANLYISSFQLHSTLNLSEVLKIIVEIVINLIGAERFAIYIADERTGALQPVACEGDSLASFPTARLGEGIVGEAVQSGETFCADPNASTDARRPIVCIPLRLEDRPIGAIAIYALLAVPLRSYLQPLVIMLVIPFGAVGAALGHLLLGYDLTMYSVIGIVALSGMVVNASLVLVDSVNQRRVAGDRLIDAVRTAGRGRLRAIFLTELTTFVGLVPMMFERAMFARFMIPLAVSLAFGVIFASVITLVIVPCAYVILEDLQLWATGTQRRRAAERIAAARAEQGARERAEQQARERGYAAPAAWVDGSTRES